MGAQDVQENEATLQGFLERRISSSYIASGLTALGLLTEQLPPEQYKAFLTKVPTRSQRWRHKKLPKNCMFITFSTGSIFLFRISSAHCRSLHEAGSVTAKPSKLFQGYVQELQAEINQELLETMHATELEDWGRFGKIRQAEEKRLRDPDDVFIHAQERKEEIARERRKTRRKK
jgi:hypothetical protein